MVKEVNQGATVQNRASTVAPPRGWGKGNGIRIYRCPLPLFHPSWPLPPLPLEKKRERERGVITFFPLEK